MIASGGYFQLLLFWAVYRKASPTLQVASTLLLIMAYTFPGI